MHLKFLSSWEGEEPRWRLLWLLKGCRRAGSDEGKAQPHSLDFGSSNRLLSHSP